MDNEKETEKSDNFHEEIKPSSELQDRNDEEVENNSEKNEHSLTQKRRRENSSDCTKEMKNLHGAVALMIMSKKSFNEHKNEEKNNSRSRPASAQSVTSSSLSLNTEMAYTELKEENEEENAANPNVAKLESTALFQTCIPYLPIEIAVVCLIFNILVPGFGSILCGVSNFCCGKMQRTVKKDDVPMKLFINLLVGLMQLLTVTFLLVGWFWSVAWGIKILLLSIENRKKIKQLKASKRDEIKFAFTYADADTAAVAHHGDTAAAGDNDDTPAAKY